MATAKEEVRKMLNQIPDDASLEDIQYHLYVLDKIQSGLERARVEGTKTQAEVEEQFRNKWITT